MNEPPLFAMLWRGLIAPCALSWCIQISPITVLGLLASAATSFDLVLFFGGGRGGV